MTVAESLELLARRLRAAGAAPDAEELADALWLARHVPGTATDPPRPSTTATTENPNNPNNPKNPKDPENTRSTENPKNAAQSPAGPPDGCPDAPPEASLALPEGGRLDGRRSPAPVDTSAEGGEEALGTGVPTRVPAASVLPDPLALQRALQPLNRFRPPSRPMTGALDEEATARRAADTGVVVPVASREPRREARLQLVMDLSSSTVVWADTFTELRQVCERSGAFREIRTQYVHEDGRGGLRVASSPDPTAPGSGPGLLRDPSGRRLTLVLSDCAGPLWRGGRMQRLLHDWASCAPLAVVQPLPQRMWRGTHLPAHSGVLERGDGPAGRLGFRSGRAPSPGPRALPVPVLALRPASLTNWVRLVCDATAQRLLASAAWVRSDHPPTAVRRLTEREISTSDRVHAFRRTASQDARQLAGYLATVPLALPVMQLVQRAMLPASGPEAMAEILLGGLMRRSDDVVEGGYEFIDEVRGELLRRLPGGEARLVLKHSSQYVERQYGRSARNFPALAATYLSGATTAGPVVEDGTDDRLLRAFARISSQVLARYGRVPAAPPGAGPQQLASRARELLDRYASQGTARDLDEGIGLLHRALAVERRQTEQHALRGRLAGALLERWRAAGTPDNLREAYETLPRRGKGDPAEVLTEGRILLHIAADLETAGTAAATLPAALGRDLGEPDARPRRLALLAYEAARRRLEELPSGAEPSLVTRGIELRARIAFQSAALVARVGAEALGADDESPRAWAARQFELAAGLATQHRLRDDRSAPRLFESRVLLALARHAATDGAGLRSDPARRDRAQRAAVLAEVGLREVLPLRAAEGAPAAELARVCLDTADAVALTRNAEQDPRARRRILDLLDQALRYAGEDEALRSECFDRLGAAYMTSYDLTDSADALESAIRCWRQAAGQLPLDAPGRPRLLHRLGGALLTAREWNDAVRVLRTAVDESPERDPELPRHRVELGNALLRRHRARGGLSDLHEAHWILGTAARETDDDLLAARAWQLRAAASAGLAGQSTQHSNWENAAEYLLRAAELYRARELPDQEARVRLERGDVLSRAAAPARAAEEYRTALRRYEEAGLPDDDGATRARAALRGLTPGAGTGTGEAQHGGS